VSYADDQTSAKQLLAEAGQAVTLTPPTTGTYDPNTATVTGAAPTPVTTTGVVLPLSRGLKHMPGTDITASDQQLLLPGDIAEPVLDTKATIGGVDYTIKEVAPLNPGGTSLLYDCVIRGAP
jgi:hypothetical protein